MRGQTPERMTELRSLSAQIRSQRAAMGADYARAWRIRNKPYFDAIYGGEA